MLLNAIYSLIILFYLQGNHADEESENDSELDAPFEEQQTSTKYDIIAYN